MGRMSKNQGKKELDIKNTPSYIKYKDA